jgi:DNA polymerase I
MTRLYAIDANGIAHWLWHSQSARTDEAGNEMSLVDATRQWWHRFVLNHKPTHAAIVFDGPHNWRWKEHAEYKSSRIAKPRDEEKIAALKTVPAAWEALGLKVLCYDTFEADDAIASIANKMAADDCEVVVVSSDKDMLQLVGPNVKAYDPRPNKAGVCMYYDEKAVEEKMYVPPHRVRELLAIWGDTSDDVPGIAGCGKDTAALAIKQTRSVKEIFSRAAAGTLSNITVARQKKLAEGRADFDLSFKLVSLRYDVPVPTEIEAYAIKPQVTPRNRCSIAGCVDRVEGYVGGDPFCHIHGCQEVAEQPVDDLYALAESEILNVGDR